MAQSGGRKGRILGAAVVLAALAAGIFLVTRQHAASEDQGRLTLYGNVDVREVNLAFRVPGRLQRLKVDEGDVVKAGDVLAQIDPVYLKLALDQAQAQEKAAKATLDKLEAGSRPQEIAQARANVAQAKAAAANARIQFLRQRRLLATRTASRQAYDNAKAALDQAEAQLQVADEALTLAVLGPRKEDVAAARAQWQAAQTALDLARQQLADATLTAPEGGIIKTRVAEPGTVLAAGAPVLSMALTHPLWVRTYVPETDLGKVHPGMAAEIRTDSFPDRVYRGHVGFISPEAEFTPKTVQTPELRTNLVYRLRVIVDGPDQTLRQGMPVTVTLSPDR